MGEKKKLTILHSNDMHGDFLAEDADGALLGGVSMLSGYIQKVRREEENVLYAIAGDMFRGSVIDSEYKGVSTIGIMNMLAPDVVTLGNHEVDYGVAHLLFLEKCARFPIINANMYIATNRRRMFRSHIVLEKGGMRILFIGVLTQKVLSATKQDPLIGSFVDVHEAAEEVGRICNTYRTEDIDLTVLLTHIGIEEDKALAAALDPRWGVDLIIGGHSHTLLEEPCVVNGVPIVQAACGTDQIGRFDIVVDTAANAIDSYSWKLIPVMPEVCPRDPALEEVVAGYKAETDSKYERFVTRLAERYTHPVRNRETQLGKLLADALRDALGVDLVFLGSGSIRGEALGPIVRYRDLAQIYPYNDEFYRIEVTGEQLRRMVRFVLREEGGLGGLSSFYQVSRGFRAEYDMSQKQLVSLSFNGYEVQDHDRFTVGLQSYHMNNIKKVLGINPEEVSHPRRPKVLCTRSGDVLEEYLGAQELLRVSDENRIVLR